MTLANGAQNTIASAGPDITRRAAETARGEGRRTLRQMGLEPRRFLDMVANRPFLKSSKTGAMTRGLDFWPMDIDCPGRACLRAPWLLQRRAERREADFPTVVADQRRKNAKSLHGTICRHSYRQRES